MTILFEDDEVRAHAHDAVIAMAWHATPRATVVRALERAVRPYHDENPRGVGLIVLPFASTPDDEARAALHELAKHVGGSVLGAAAVLALEGLKGRVLRGVANGVIGAMGLPFPVRLVDSRSAAASHIVELVVRRRVASPTVRDVERTLELVGAPLSRR